MVLSTLMELAIEAALPEGARLGAASSLRTTPEGPVPSGHRYALRAEVVGLSARAARAEASLIDEDGRVLVRGEATYHVTRD